MLQFSSSLILLHEIPSVLALKFLCVFFFFFFVFVLMENPSFVSLKCVLLQLGLRPSLAAALLLIPHPIPLLLHFLQLVHLFKQSLLQSENCIIAAEILCKFYCTCKRTNLLYNRFCGDKCRSHEVVDLIMCRVNFLGVWV